MNYRLFYFQKLGLKPIEGFDVHHIDLDRANNNILNLVALPSKLHKAYHKSFFMRNPNNVISISPIPPSSVSYSGNGFLSLVYREFSEFMPIYLEIQAWISYRDHLLTGCPNFNKLSYDKY